MMDDNHKYGECPLCHQSRMLTWVIGQVKGSDRLFSGYICQECYKKTNEQDVERMNKKENITINNPMDGDVARCKCCHTKNDVRDIEFHGYNLTDVVSLCVNCRRELAEKLKECDQ